MDYSNIKLVIWDLDETFWQGTLSEGEVCQAEPCMTLVRMLTDHGIVNSICSKNDYQPAVGKLKEWGVDEFFVFKSIDWTPKGPRISKLIKDMGLRPVNCLFIDDNVVNLNEARFYEKDLMIAEPRIVPKLIDYIQEIAANDTEHKRLKNYQVLEQKQAAKAEAQDNLAFLYDSDTRVKIHRDCNKHLDRICELVARTNQLNYTKVRSTREEIESLCNDSSVDTGYVTVSDRFGDYGIVGFFAIKDNQCLHFLFSCRTIGQGVEQYVYAILGHPMLTVAGEVVNAVTANEAPEWINQSEKNSDNTCLNKMNAKVILKGACDLKVMSEYLNTESIIEEFTYTGLKRGNWIEHQNHSVNYLQWYFLPDDVRQELIDGCIFNDEEMFATSIYDKDVAIIFLSTMIEPNLGIYRRKKDGLLIAFGEYLYPLTNPDNWELYIQNKIFTAQNTFTREWLDAFSRTYEFVGNLSPDDIVEQAKKLLLLVNSQTKICYMLGSETPYEKNTQENYNNRHLIYKAINERFRKLAKENDRVMLIDFNDFIRSQDDFTNNINHFQRRIYYQIATKANEYIAQVTGERLEQKSKWYLWRKELIDKIGYTGFYQTPLWAMLRKPYIFFKKKQ